MRVLACLVLLVFSSTAPIAGSSIVGSWIGHIEIVQDPEFSASICVTFRADGTFSFRFRAETELDKVSGLYELKDNQLQLRMRGRDPDVSRVKVEGDRLWLFVADDDSDKDPGLMLERTPWCK